MKYELIHEDDKSFKIKHPDGSHFKVAKRGLSPANIKRIQGMKPIMLADGGVVPDSGTMSISTDPNSVSVPDSLSQGSQSQIPAPSPSSGDAPYMQPDDVAQATQQAQPTSQSSAPVSAQAAPDRAPAAAIPGNSNTMAAGFGLEKAGIQNKAKAEAQAAQGQDQAYGQYLSAQPSMDQLQKHIQDYQTAEQSLRAQNDQLTKAVTSGQIDPNRVWNNTSTGNKIMATIGLVLGGIAGGGKTNLVLDQMKDTINKDIEAQKANLGKQQNLLTINMERYKNMEQAEAATRLQMGTIVQAHIAQAAAKAGTPLAMANAQMMTGQIEMEKAPLMQQMAMRSALQSSAQGASAGVNRQDPASYVPYLVHEAHQKDVFNEIKQAQNAAGSSDQILKNFDQAAKDNTVLRTGGGYLRTPASIQAIRAMTLPIIHDAEGRVNEFEQKTLSDLEPKPGDTDGKIAQKRVALQNFLEQKKAAPTAKAYGIDLNRFASTTSDPAARMAPKVQNYVQWARQNPNDPDAKLVLRKAGLTR